MQTHQIHSKYLCSYIQLSSREFIDVHYTTGIHNIPDNRLQTQCNTTRACIECICFPYERMVETTVIEFVS